ncbi:hypothetical protein [Egbenema bharatensis]
MGILTPQLYQPPPWWLRRRSCGITQITTADLFLTGFPRCQVRKPIALV